MKDKEMIEEMAKIMLESMQVPDNINSAVKVEEVNKAYYLAFLNYATHLYNAGCRIVAKDSVVISKQEYLNTVTKVREEFEYEYKDKVVLSREEYEKKEKQIKDLKYALKVHSERLDHFYNLNEDVYYYEEKQAEAVKQARKETAEKIFPEALKKVREKFEKTKGYTSCYDVVITLMELAKQLGVEIKD